VAFLKAFAQNHTKTTYLYFLGMITSKSSARKDKISGTMTMSSNGDDECCVERQRLVSANWKILDLKQDVCLIETCASVNLNKLLLTFCVICCVLLMMA